MVSLVKSHPVPFVLGLGGVSSILINYLKNSIWYSNQYSDLALMKAILNSPRKPTNELEIAQLKYRCSLVNFKLSTISVLSKYTPRIRLIAFTLFALGVEEKIHKH